MSSLSGNLGSVQLNTISQHHQINIPRASHTNSAQRGPLKLPCQELLNEGREEEYLEICFPLCKASRTGDWKVAKDILDQRKELVRFSINGSNETALHVAVYAGNTLFVENLVELMDKDDMELLNNSSNTALCLAAVAGHVEVAKILVTKHKALLDITGNEEKTPLYMAALSKRGHMVKYLYQNSEKMTGDPWTDETRGSVLVACVEAEIFDVALQIVDDRPELAVSEGSSILQILARKPRSFRKENRYIKKYKFYCGAFGRFMLELLADEEAQAAQLLKNIWKEIVKLPKAKIDEMLRGSSHQIPKGKFSSSVLFVAAEMGNTTFIWELILHYRELVLEINDNKQSIFHVAITHRQRGVYSLLHQIGSMKDSIINLEDEEGNNMLHLIGIPKKKETSSQVEVIEEPILEMRQELLWSKEIRAILPPSLAEKKNKAGATPHELFVENHKQLVSEGVDWIKKASSDLLVVAVLTAGITFAAAITFVGGYKQETGKPVFYENEDFNAFLALVATSFLFASISIFCLLSVSSSHHSGGNYLIRLTLMLTVAIAFLCQSMMFMIIAFSNNFILLLPKKFQSTQITVRVCSWIVAMLFMCMLFGHYIYFLMMLYRPSSLSS